MPKKTSEVGQIQNTFLDPTGTHLLISTSLGENYSLNYQSTKAKSLGRLKGLHITSIAWNPAHPTRSTGEILLGTDNGLIYETFLEPSDEYFKREDRYIRQVWKSPNEDAIMGINVTYGKDSSVRKVMATTNSGRIYFWQGKVSNHSSQDTIPVYPKFFEREEPVMELFEAQEKSCLAIAPKPAKPPRHYIPVFGWLMGFGVMHGKIPLTSSATDAKNKIFKESDLFLSTELNAADSQHLQSLVLTEYHILLLANNTIYGINRLNNQVVFRESIPGEPIIGLYSDSVNSTYWAYTSDSIYEIVVDNEDREIWKTLLENKEYEEALRLTKDLYSRDVVLMAYGDYCLESQNYPKAAQLLGASSKPFESAALSFIDAKKYDALQIYLSTKLKALSKSGQMQRILVASWIIELYMEKLNSLEDSAAAKSEAQLSNGPTNSEKDTDSDDEFSQVVKSFQDFVTSHGGDLDKSIVYEIISSHSRRDELLFYASSINDRQFVLNYWIRIERWTEALLVVQAENDPRLYYKYATVLMVNSPKATVDTWMRNSELDPTKFIPAILAYTKGYRPSNSGETNQAIRYLKFCINHLKSTEAIIHNTLIAFYASTTAMDEAPLVTFLEEQSSSGTVYYDVDFALRLCTKYNRIQASVHIYSSMDQYEEAIKIALAHDNTELAGLVADRVMDASSGNGRSSIIIGSNGPAAMTTTTILSPQQELCKSLWLEIARHVINETESHNEWFKSTASVLSRCPLLKIEDLLPLFPDFVEIDSFKSELVESMERYNRTISQLNKEMDESVVLAQTIRDETARYERGYALIEPGEQCFLCGFPLATRRFYVFPCQHSFHCDCLLDAVLKSQDYKLINKIRDIKTQYQQQQQQKLQQQQLQQQQLGGSGSSEGNKSGVNTPNSIKSGGANGSGNSGSLMTKEEMGKLIDDLLLHNCILCSDARIESVDSPLVSVLDSRAQAMEWAI